MPTRLAFLAALAVVIVSCIDPLDVPSCTPATLTPLSTSADTVVTSTGLRYINTAEAQEGFTADWCRAVAITYGAYLVDGTRFDTTSLENPLIFTPGLGGLIDGLEQGVIGMRPNAVRRLIVPPQLGFGSEPRRDATGAVVVPGNSTLIYDLRVLQVQSPQ